MQGRTITRPNVISRAALHGPLIGPPPKCARSFTAAGRRKSLKGHATDETAAVPSPRLEPPEDSTPSTSSSHGDGLHVSVHRPRDLTTVPSIPEALRRILALAIPSLGTVMIDPLMSLVDTAAVGNVSTLQLAAMGPCTSIFGMFFMIFYFINTAVCNFVGREDDPKKASEAISNALAVCAMCSVALLCVLLPFGPQLLTAVGASDPEMLAAALPYLTIRALAAPAVLLSFALNGLFLAKLETRIPFVVSAWAGLLNLVGDIFLVFPQFLNMGLAGAAVATVASQYLAAGAMWVLCQRKAADWGLEVRFRGLPTWQAMVEIANVGSALISRSIFMMLCYTGLTRTATLLGPTPLAAHQVALQAWWFISCVNEPVLLAAQALLTRETRGGLGAAGGLSPSALRIAKVIVVIALGVAAALALTTAGVFSWLPWVFTSDPLVQEGVRSISLQGSISMFVICSVMACDGITIGMSDWNHLQQTNFFAMVVTTAALVALQRSGLNSLVMVWNVLNVFCAARIANHLRYFGSKLARPKGAAAAS